MEKSPNKYQLLGELSENLDSGERPYKVFYNNNMGNRTFIIDVPIYDFYRMSDVASDHNVNINEDEVSQRPIDLNHAYKLTNYILKGLVSSVISDLEKQQKEIPSEYKNIQHVLGSQPYISLQPIVCNLRNCERDGSDLRGRRLMVEGIGGLQELAAHEVLLSQKHILWVVDGQHRRKAIDFTFDFLDSVLLTHTYPSKKMIFPITNKKVSEIELQLWKECYNQARINCSVVAEVHLGLDTEEERQLFFDLNRLVKNVETSLAYEFDRGNPINIFVQDKLIEMLEWPIAKKDIVNWQQDEGSITLKDLMSINTRLILNKTNARGATPAVVEPKLALAIRFWEAVKQIQYMGKPGAKANTVAAQPVMLKALAKLVYDFSYGKNKNSGQLDYLLKSIPEINFSHDNYIWRYYAMTEDERKKNGISGLKEYLPDDSNQDADYNRDIGSYDPKAGTMRFGAKHNDIFPILGDMIRWSLKLPSRHKKAA